MKAARTYDMSRRAQGADATRERILDAAIAGALEAPLSALTLPAIAERAGVSVQTVLRGFGSREALIDAAAERGRRVIGEERAVVPGDAEASLGILLDHYDQRGDGVILLLAQEGWEPQAAAITAKGRAMHRAWVEEVFAGAISAASRDAREELTDMLVIATDVYAWKLLRRDRRLGRVETLCRMKALVAAVLGQAEGSR